MKRTLSMTALASMFAIGLAADGAEDKKAPTKPAEAKKDAPPAGDKKASPDAKKDDKGAAPDPSMAAMMELGQPGPEHKLLESMVGNWDHLVKWRMNASAPWEESKGTSMREMLFGGRYVRQETKSPPMAPGSPPFEGRAIFGFDRFRKQYVNLWIDNESTHAMVAYGTAEPSEKTITYSSEGPDMMNPGKLKKTKSVYRLKDDKTHVYEMYDTGPDGKEFVMLEVTYTKK